MRLTIGWLMAAAGALLWHVAHVSSTQAIWPVALGMVTGWLVGVLMCAVVLDGRETRSP